MADDHFDYFWDNNNNNNNKENDGCSTADQPPPITNATTTTTTTTTAAQVQQQHYPIYSINADQFPFASFEAGLVSGVDMATNTLPSNSAALFPDSHSTIIPPSSFTANHNTRMRATTSQNYLSVEDIMAILAASPSSSFHPSPTTITPTIIEDYYDHHQHQGTQHLSFDQFPIEYFQQQNQQWPTFLSSFQDQQQQDDIPHGSPRRRVSYNEALVLPRNNVDHTITNLTTTTTATSSSPTAALRNLMARRRGGTFPTPSPGNRNIASRRLSIDSSNVRLTQQQQRQRQSSMTATTENVSSPTATINFNSLSILSPTATRTPPPIASLSVNQPPQRIRQQRQGPSQIILTPHDFATSVSLTQQHMVHVAADHHMDTTSSSHSRRNSDTNTTTSGVDGEYNDDHPNGIISPEARSVRNYENELRYLRDQWTSICIALSSLRSMYLAVSTSTTNFSDPSAASSTGESSRTGESASGNTSTGNTKGDETKESACHDTKEQVFMGFPIPSSVLVTSFVGTPMPVEDDLLSSSSSRGKKKKQRKVPNRGTGRARHQRYGKRITSLTPRGLHPDIEHEMLIGYDDALLQLRQLQLRVEALEAEIQRLKGETSTNNNTSSTEEEEQRSTCNSSLDEDEEEEDEEKDDDEE